MPTSNNNIKPANKLQILDDDGNSNNNNAKQSIMRQHNNFEQQFPMAHLVIEEPKISDEALYKCDVTYVKGKCPSISLVRVQILALPAKAQILIPPPTSTTAATSTTNPDQPILAGDGQLIGPFNEHDQLKLSCLVHGGRPQPRSVIWRKIDSASGRVTNLLSNMRPTVLFTDKEVPAIQVDLNYTLGSSDMSSKFECHIEHDALDQTELNTRTNNNQQDSLKSQPTTQQPGSDGQDSMLDLHPSGITPPSLVSKQLFTSDNNNNENQISANINSKSLDSHVTVDLNVGASSVDLFMTKVNKRNSSDSLKEGDLIELECVAYNAKPPANITWYNGADIIEQLDSSIGNNNIWQQQNQKPNQRHKRLLQRNQVHQNDDGQTFNTHSFLSIKLSRHEHKAQINCHAQNAQMRQPLIKSLELQVQHAPIVLMEPASGIVVNELQSPPAPLELNSSEEGNLLAKFSGDNNNNINNKRDNQINIYCIYTANPTELLPNSTRWFKDGLPLNILDNNRHRFSESITQTGYPVLSINQVNRRDAGYYDCQVANSIGLSERLASSEACKIEVNFRPTVRMRLFKPIESQQKSPIPSPSNHFKLDDLIELDLNQELILPGNSYVFMCDVVEAQPSKIQKFYWFKRPLKPPQQQQQQQKQQEQEQLLSITEFNQFVLNSLSANFTPASYACSASNALGVSDNSDRIDLQLSYSPGPSFVRPVFDATQRKNILVSGRASTQSSITTPYSDSLLTELAQQPISAGKEFLLECHTPDLGQPRANIWLWFKNGQPIESSPNLISQSSSYDNSNNNNRNLSPNYNTDESIPDNGSNNPISGYGNELSLVAKSHQRRTSTLPVSNPALLSSQEIPSSSNSIISLLGSGRYLFIPSIQLAHKGNYSCVAVNRLGSGLQHHHHPQQQQQQSFSSIERDSYQIRVALAPSFVKPLPEKSYWSEKDQNGQHLLELELVCHIQCEPMCQIEWYKNNELIDFKRQTSLETNYLHYQVKQSIMDENLDANLFKSIESRLSLQFTDFSNQKDSRQKILERRHILNGSNYTCQSTSNSIGPPVKSTTKFIVQYSPESVIINASSDKLNLIEGSNGPKLVCEALAEPKAQYRWFLIRGGNVRGNKWESILYKTNNNNLKSSIEASNGAIFQSINDGVRKETTLDQPINQLDNKALQPNYKGIGTVFSKGANDARTEILEANNLIELTSSATEQALVGGSFTSTLDLSNTSMDRRQTGHYVCEASNKLGQMGQSVYVNIQYKPVCASLHLHSLDMTMAPTINKMATKNSAIQLQEFNYNSLRPIEATSNDEYSIIRQSNEDYVDLRRLLITSPLLYHGLTSTENFKNSIFQTILNDKKIDKEFDPSQVLGSNARLKAKDALIHSDDDDINNDNDNQSETKQYQNNILLDNNNTKIASGDSWERFNHILLKFLNNYVRQVKDYENKFFESINNRKIMPIVHKENKQINHRQNRRSQQTSEQTANEEQDLSTKNIITFACMAQDANPMNNLTFDWYFGSINIKENLSDNNFFDSSTPEVTQLKLEHENSKPILLYSNENYTLHVVLVRRLDTKLNLNPFQMSLLTLNVILEPQQQQQLMNEPQYSTRNVRQMDDGHNNNVNKTFRAPVIRNRYQSFYNSVNGPKANKNNIQFTQEFYTKPYNGDTPIFPSKSPSNNVGIELNEQNWEEQIGNLLKCSVANQIGVSDECHVRLNIEERLKTKGLSTHGSSSTNFEFAKWGVPSLAYKSILGILICCTLSIIAISILILGPYIKCGLIMKVIKNNNDNEENNDNNKADSNTNQSTSQKSSVLGLLGDNSTQGSSDDDSTARMTNHHHHHHELNVNNHKMLAMPDIMNHNTYQYNPQQMLKESDPSSNYDEPRASYIHTDDDGIGQQTYNEMSPDTHLPNSSTYKAYSNGLSPNISRELDVDLNKNYNALGSSASKLLANLRIKSLSSKFKVDRISDLTNSFRGNLHIKNVSNSGTNTTGLSSSNFSDNNSTDQTTVSKLISPTSSNNSSTTFFGDSNLRHSYSGFKHPTTTSLRTSKQKGYIYDKSGLKDSNDSMRQMMKLNHRNNAFLETPTYLNMLTSLNNNNNNIDNNNPMDRFIQQREIINTNDSFYRSQSVRNPIFSVMSVVSNENDLVQQQQHQSYQMPQELQNLNRGPPVYPRTMYSRHANYGARGNSNLTMTNERPQIAAIGRNHLLNNNTTTDLYRYSINTNNPSAIMQYNHPNINNNQDDMTRYRQPVTSTLSYNVDTIDSHLNRFTDNNAIATYYQNQQQLINYANNNNISKSEIYNNDAYNNQTDTIEHIYDTNAYATPEQTPMKKFNRSAGSSDAGEQITKPRVSQLIQSFNSKAPE